ncbi:MAG: peptide chain release factor N(5)-glutamine methyltransferase [Pseudomonadota bacterium]
MTDPRSEPKPLTASDLYTEAVSSLNARGMDTPELDANILLEHLAGVTTLTRLTSPNTPISMSRVSAFQSALERRMMGEPVHRIIGQREFYGLPFSISPDTLVPRPDTETLVDIVGPYVEAKAQESGHCRVLDLGTGTGILALTLLTLSDDVTATGTDLSPGALKVAQNNATALGLAGRFTAIHSNWFENITCSYDVVVSNPPYIPTHTISGLDADVRDHDPKLALDGGADGLQAYKTIAEYASHFLNANGMIAVEIGFDQAAMVTIIFEQQGFKKVRLAMDLGGRDRALLFKM